MNRRGQISHFIFLRMQAFEHLDYNSVHVLSVQSCFEFDSRVGSGSFLIPLEDYSSWEKNEKGDWLLEKSGIVTFNGKFHKLNNFIEGFKIQLHCSADANFVHVGEYNELLKDRTSEFVQVRDPAFMWAGTIFEDTLKDRFLESYKSWFSKLRTAHIEKDLGEKFSGVLTVVNKEYHLKRDGLSEEARRGLLQDVTKILSESPGKDSWGEKFLSKFSLRDIRLSREDRLTKRGTDSAPLEMEYSFVFDIEYEYDGIIETYYILYAKKEVFLWPESFDVPPVGDKFFTFQKGIATPLFEGFCALFQSKLKELQEKIPESTKEKQMETSELFRMLDIDNSGGIDLEEFRATTGVVFRDEQQLQEAFNKIDSNGNGFIEYDELRRFLIHETDLDINLIEYEMEVYVQIGESQTYVRIKAFLNKAEGVLSFYSSSILVYVLKISKKKLIGRKKSLAYTAARQVLCADIERLAKAPFEHAVILEKEAGKQDRKNFTLGFMMESEASKAAEVLTDFINSQRQVQDKKASDAYSLGIQVVRLCAFMLGDSFFS